MGEGFGFVVLSVTAVCVCHGRVCLSLSRKDTEHQQWMPGPWPIETSPRTTEQRAIGPT